jgi:hypothetical protein
MLRDTRNRGAQPQFFVQPQLVCDRHVSSSLNVEQRTTPEQAVFQMQPSIAPHFVEASSPCQHPVIGSQYDANCPLSGRSHVQTGCTKHPSLVGHPLFEYTWQ